VDTPVYSPSPESSPTPDEDIFDDPEPSPVEESEPEPEPVESTDPPDPPEEEFIVDETVGEAFSVTPSGNIGCAMYDDGARCDIQRKSWSVSAPADCDLDYGHALAVGDEGEGLILCAGDSTGFQGGTLAYGRAIRLGNYLCASSSTGVRCENEYTGHGFSLARADYSLF
jgi:hypothetical protein